MEDLGLLPTSGQILFSNGHSGISAEVGDWERGAEWVWGSSRSPVHRRKQLAANHGGAEREMTKAGLHLSKLQVQNRLG